MHTGRMSLGGPACRRCGRSGASRTNILGEAVCDRCREAQLGMALGAMRGGGVGEGIVTAKAFQRIRQFLRRPRD